MPRKSRKARSASAQRANKGKLTKLLALTLCASLATVGLKIVTHSSFIKLPTLKEQKAGVEVYDINDKLVTVVQKDGEREPIGLDKISPFMRQAVIGIEDHNFYHHPGIDPLGITRAMYKNAMARQWIEGGSTITQQLMKTMYFGHDDKTARRKILEMFMALDIETCYSKDKILETYLNEVYYGRGAYGIERASQTYFNKPASKLTLAESAFLAALIKAPSDLGQEAHFKRAQTRQKEVLDGMTECGFITKDQASKAKTAKLAFKPGPHALRHPYYINHVVALVKQEIGEDKLFESPLKIYTNLDVAAQRKAEAALSRGVAKAPRGVDQGAVVSIDLNNGAVVALVGGVGPYATSQFNRALNPHTAGSSFKPFVYLAGLINKAIGPESVLNDSPIAIPLSYGRTYTPQNYDGEFKGLMTVRDAISQSRNVCAVQVGQSVGVDRVINTARRAGITTEMEPVPSLALGTCAVSPLELANAYATIARGGEYVQPLFIRHINNKDGKVIKEFKASRSKRLPEEPCLQIADSMEDVVKNGTGRKASLRGVAVAGKTGTADDFKDVWFVGFTPDVVTAVWAGNDDNDAVHGRGITGGTIAAGIWSQYMSGYYKDHSKPLVGLDDPQQRLTSQLPYVAYFPHVFEDTEETASDVVRTVDWVATEATAASKPKHKTSFFRRLGNHIKEWF